MIDNDNSIDEYRAIGTIVEALVGFIRATVALVEGEVLFDPVNARLFG
jgi:hypothetical protein